MESEIEVARYLWDRYAKRSVASGTYIGDPDWDGTSDFVKRTWVNLSADVVELMEKAAELAAPPAPAPDPHSFAPHPELRLFCRKCGRRAGSHPSCGACGSVRVNDACTVCYSCGASDYDE